MRINLLRHFNITAALIAAVFVLIFFSDSESPAVRRPDSISRVISLSPSITREIIDLGGERLLAGVSEYHPPLQKKIPVVGSLIQFDLERIAYLRPDLVIFSMEDNPTQGVDMISSIGLNTLVLPKNTDFGRICANYLTLASHLGLKDVAGKKVLEYRRLLGSLTAGKKIASAAFFISLNPLIPAGGGSYIGNIISDAGGLNVFGNIGKAYPIISPELLVSMDPDVIISIMPGAEEFFMSLLGEFKKVKALKPGRIYLVDPENICYYTPGDYVRSVEMVKKIITGAMR
jgi:iron complex transport system substrate-binding protein